MNKYIFSMALLVVLTVALPAAAQNDYGVWKKVEVQDVSPRGDSTQVWGLYTRTAPGGRRHYQLRIPGGLRATLRVLKKGKLKEYRLSPSTKMPRLLVRGGEGGKGGATRLRSFSTFAGHLPRGLGCKIPCPDGGNPCLCAQPGHRVIQGGAHRVRFIRLARCPSYFFKSICYSRFV